MRPWWKRTGGQQMVASARVPERLTEIPAPPVGGGERKTIHVTPPAEPEHVAQSPMTDADRAEMWKRTAETRRIDNLDLRAENDRLRADLALARNLAVRQPVDCGHEATLRRYDALLERCRAEHVDRDELERRVGAAARVERWPF